MKKQWIKNATFILFIAMVSPVFAQEPNLQQEKSPHEIPSPERNARRISKEMRKSLQLTDEQYAKVYELYLKEQKESMSAISRHGNMPPQGGRMGHHQRGGNHGDPGMGGGMPPEGNNFRPDFGGQARQNMEKTRKEEEKKREKSYKKLDKKMKKLLSTNQYIQWKTLEINRRSKGRQQKDSHSAPAERRPENQEK